MINPLGIKDAKPRACTGKKSAIVGSRGSISFLTPLKPEIIKNRQEKILDRIIYLGSYVGTDAQI